jgi:predicted nucleic acid-binding Zn ribbon protein
MTEEAISACPKCAAPVKRLISRNLTIQFRGPGFHVNDYPARGGAGRTGDGAANPGGAAGDSGRTATEAAKTEAKPAATGE